MRAAFRPEAIHVRAGDVDASEPALRSGTWPTSRGRAVFARCREASADVRARTVRTWSNAGTGEHRAPLAAWAALLERARRDVDAAVDLAASWADDPDAPPDAMVAVEAAALAALAWIGAFAVDLAELQDESIGAWFCEVKRLHRVVEEAALQRVASLAEALAIASGTLRACDDGAVPAAAIRLTLELVTSRSTDVEEAIRDWLGARPTLPPPPDDDAIEDVILDRLELEEVDPQWRWRDD